MRLEPHFSCVLARLKYLYMTDQSLRDEHVAAIFRAKSSAAKGGPPCKLGSLLATTDKCKE